jgi:hypothetical protein
MIDITKDLSLESKEPVKFSFEEFDLHLPMKKTISLNIRDVLSFSLPKTPNVEYRLIVRGELNEIKLFKKSNKYKELIGIISFKALSSSTHFKKSDMNLGTTKFTDVVRGLDESQSSQLTDIFKEYEMAV